jgi:hypothetical protein
MAEIIIPGVTIARKIQKSDLLNHMAIGRVAYVIATRGQITDLKPDTDDVTDMPAGVDPEPGVLRTWDVVVVLKGTIIEGLCPEILVKGKGCGVESMDR